MGNKSDIKQYTWDIAISLCKQDIDFARTLVNALNPSLNVFFYENNQEELISKSGPEVFANIFKEQSRVVIILSRKEWSESYYTEIERNAIIDRTAVKNQGYQFLMIFPMVQGEIPIWYPSTRIYADPHRFTIEELARFIEFKVTDEGGSIKSITVEDRYQRLIERINNKKSIIQLQTDKDAIQNANDEIIALKDCFNSKGVFLRKSVFNSPIFNSFDEYSNRANFSFGEFRLDCNIILPDEIYDKIYTTQDFVVSFEIFQIFDNGDSKKRLAKEERLFYYTPELKGWSLQHLYEHPSQKELLLLFHNREYLKYYELTKPISTAEFVDFWFQLLLSKSTQTIEKFV
jgi:hypothetical protein